MIVTARTPGRLSWLGRLGVLFSVSSFCRCCPRRPSPRRRRPRRPMRRLYRRLRPGPNRRTMPSRSCLTRRSSRANRSRSGRSGRWPFRPTASSWRWATAGRNRRWEDCGCGTWRNAEWLPCTRQPTPCPRSPFTPTANTWPAHEFDGTVDLRDPITGKVNATLSGHTTGVNSVSFTADSKTLAAAGLDQIVTVWDVATAKQRLRLAGHTDMVLSVAFASNGKTLASARRARTRAPSYGIWERARRGPRSTDTRREWSSSPSPDGKTVATGGWDGVTKLWDAAEGKERKTLAGPGGSIFCVAYSPDGKTLAASVRERTARCNCGTRPP